MIILYETWTHSKSNIGITGYKSYNLYRKFQHRRANRCSGGIVVYIKDSISAGVDIVENHFDTIIWFKLNNKFFKTENDVYISCVYMWGENSPAYNHIDVDLFSILQSDITHFQSHGTVLLCGDWNARVGNGSRPDYIVCDRYVDSIDDDDYLPDVPLPRRSLDSTCNSHGIKLLDLCKSTSLRIANGRLGSDHQIGTYTYTCHTGSSVIDYLILSQHDFSHIANFKIGSFCEWSDHAPLSFDIRCNMDVTEDDNTYRYTKIKWKESLRDDFRRGIIGKLTDLNSAVNSIDTTDTSSIDTCVENFTQIINDVAKPLFCKTGTYKNVSASNCYNNRIYDKSEWFDEECKTAKLLYLECLRNFNLFKSDENRQAMCHQKSKYKKLIKKKKRLFHFHKVHAIEKLKHAKPREFWKLFCKKKENSSKISLDSFFDYFSDMQQNLSSSTNAESESFCSSHNFDTDECNFSELDKPITSKEIQDVILKLKRNKAFAGDQLLNEYFIESCDILLGHLVDLFNGILNSGHFPDQWSQGIIVPLFKKNDPNDVNNYRGVTLVSCFSKIFTGVLNKRLTDWAENNNMTSDSQFGFRRGRSTTDAIFVLHAAVQKVLNEKGRLFCAFVDFRKAFDSVYLNGLWFKLFKLGINGKMLKIFKDMYNQVKTCVRACNSYSEFFECAVGLKQGEVISPLFFSLFIDDLELFLQDDPNCGLNLDDITFILMLFADDMVILGNTISDLQHGLDLLHTYCTKWGLQVNTDKTKILVFRKRGRLKDNEVWTYDGAKLEVVNDFNYLGTVFNYTGTFALNQEMLIGKGLRAMNCLLFNTRTYSLTPKVMCQLFDAFVGSILSYSSEVWGFGKCKSIERIHLKFCKTILKVKSSTCSLGVYGDLGRYPLYIQRYVRIIKFWCRIVSSDNILVSYFYKNMVESCSKGAKNWASNVKSLLDTYGFSYAWCNPLSLNLNTFHLLFKERVIDVFKQSWVNDIAQSSSLILYKDFKGEMVYERFLDILPYKLRTVISQLRLAAHQLRIVTGRYSQNRIERSLRLCTLCNSSHIEDEYHFITICSAYNQLREKYIRPYYYKRPSVYKFTLLMRSTNSTILKNLGKFVYEAFSLRNTLLQ